MAHIAQMLHYQVADVEEPVGAICQASLLGLVQFPALDRARDALLKADLGQCMCLCGLGISCGALHRPGKRKNAQGREGWTYSVVCGFASSRCGGTVAIPPCPSRSGGRCRTGRCLGRPLLLGLVLFAQVRVGEMVGVLEKRRAGLGFLCWRSSAQVELLE